MPSLLARAKKFTKAAVALSTTEKRLGNLRFEGKESGTRRSVLQETSEALQAVEKRRAHIAHMRSRGGADPIR